MSISISEGISISKSIPIITIVRICVSLGLGLRLSHYSGYCESYEKLKNGRADLLVQSKVSNMIRKNPRTRKIDPKITGPGFAQNCFEAHWTTGLGPVKP